MDKLTVTMPMQDYLDLKKKAGEPDGVGDFLNQLAALYKVARTSPMDPGAKFTEFESLRDVCFTARKLLGLDLPLKGTY